MRHVATPEDRREKNQGAYPYKHKHKKKNLIFRKVE